MENEVLLKQLVRQVKILNFWVSLFGVLFLATLAITGFLMFEAVSYIRTSTQKITDFQTKTSQTLDVQNQACNNNSLKAYLQKAGYCQ